MRQFPNWAETTLSASITSGATSFDVVSGTALRLKSNGRTWCGVIFAASYSEPGEDPNREVIYCSSVSSDTLSLVQRGRQRTTAAAHAAGAHLRIIATEDDLESTLAARSVLLYGATPYASAAAARSGGVGSSTAIATAIAELSAAGGGTVWIPRGFYLIDETVAVPSGTSNILFLGEMGSALVQENAGEEIFDLDRVSDITFSRFLFDGVGGDGETSLDGDCGIRFRSGAATPAIDDNQRLIVSECRFENLRFNGVKAEFCEGILYEKCRIITCRDGLSFHGVRDGTMRDCWIGPSMLASTSTFLSATFGANMDDDGNVNCEDIHFVDCVTSGRDGHQSFLLHSCDGGSVRGCVVRNGMQGIYLAPAAVQPLAVVRDVIVDSCKVHLVTSGTPGGDPTNSGITVGGNVSPGFKTERITISSTIVRNGGVATGDNGMAGIQFTGRTDAVKILGTEIFNSKGAGISIRGDDNTDLRIGGGTRINGVVAGDVDPGAAIDIKTGVAAGAGIMTGTIADVDIDSAVEGYRVHADDDPLETVHLYDVRFGSGVTTRNVGEVDELHPVDYGAASIARTIAAGAITVDEWSGPRTVFVDTEAAAASDTLDTITGGVLGQMIVLMAANDARTVVIAEGGNIQLDSDTSHSLDSALDTWSGVWNGSAWCEMGRVSNG